jgi:hypothetical protein
MQCLSSLDDNENATPFTHTPVELCSSVDIVIKDKGRRARVVVKRQTSSCGVTSHLTLPRALCAALRFRILRNSSALGYRYGLESFSRPFVASPIAAENKHCASARTQSTSTMVPRYPGSTR